MGFLMKRVIIRGIFNILVESSVNVAPFTKICLMCFVIPYTCIDQEVILSLILYAFRFSISLSCRLKFIQRFYYC